MIGIRTPVRRAHVDEKWALSNAILEVEHAAWSYRYATRQYHQLMRHRIANPVAVVRGAAETVLSRIGGHDAVLDELLASLVKATKTLEAVSVDPAPSTDVERDLDPWPRRHHLGSKVKL